MCAATSIAILPDKARSATHGSHSRSSDFDDCRNCGISLPGDPVQPAGRYIYIRGI